MNSPRQLRQALASTSPGRGAQFYRLCLDACNSGLFEDVAARLAPLTEGPEATNPRAWQMLGLARRGMQDSAGSHLAFRQSARFAPNDALIAHSLARTALEAGYPSAALFARARELAPSDSQVLLGEAAGRLADGDAEGALTGLSQMLDQNPGWHEGHSAFAKIAAMTASGSDRFASLRKAILRFPRDPGLWARLIEIAMQGSDYQLALRCIEEARAASGNSFELDRAMAICRNETGDPGGAKALFDRLPVPENASAFAHILRNLIRLGEYDAASRMADRKFDPAQDVHLWPYRALIWRITGDPRSEWLEGDDRLIGTYDIAATVGPMDQLADVLRSIHRGSGAPIDQSVRGGTQTDGNLLARAEPEICRLRTALLDAVQTYIAQLPSQVFGHPTLIDHRGPVRIEGSWSVRLVSEGFHVDHVHPLGWLSSAFYVALPEGPDGIGRQAGQDDGWLTFGECTSLVPELKAFRTIEPRVGTLALFPSTMWHGTRPFGAGERMTVALDIARPIA